MVCQSSDGDIRKHLFGLSSLISNGCDLEQSLDFVYESFWNVIPYDRIGYAEIDNDLGVAVARWARSNQSVLLRRGYSAPLTGSSLSIVLQKRRPRILNDLCEYLVRHPSSRSTELMVREGIKASMTCPLFIDDEPLSFLFFSSSQANVYTSSHVQILKELTVQLALLLRLAKQCTVESTQHNPVSCKTSESTNNQCSRPTMVSELKPGMTLDRAIRLKNNTLMLASGVELTKKSIDRLVVLNTQGLLDRESIRVCFPEFSLDA